MVVTRKTMVTTFDTTAKVLEVTAGLGLEEHFEYLPLKVRKRVEKPKIWGLEPKWISDIIRKTSLDHSLARGTSTKSNLL